MFNRLAADGHRTTTGGEVVGRSDFFNEYGKMYACKENHAICGICKGEWPIFGTASGWMDDGIPYVKDYGRVLHPYGKNFVLAASSSNAFYSDSKGEATVEPTPKSLTYDQQYTLKNRDDQPFANVSYRSPIFSNVIASSVTDSARGTQRITTENLRRLILEISGGV